MELRQLLAFKTVADQGSFTTAAGILRLTQSAISQQIKALEDECEVLLFDRSNRVVRLTDAGQLFLARVELILAQVENARIEMAEMAGGAKGRCRIGSLPSAAAYLLPWAIVRFQQRYPGVDLQLKEALQWQVLEWVSQGAVDFALMGLPVADTQLQSTALLQDEFVLMVPQHHDFAGRRSVGIADLVQERFILYPQGAGGRDLFMDACRQAGFEPQVVFESDDRETILGLVAAGVGVTIMPRLIARHTRVDGPVMIDSLKPRLFRQVGLVWHPNRYLPQAARNLMDLLCDLVQQHTGKGSPWLSS
ncbi:MAG: LysR substrate-binding domain-containing protein [Candidatus Tectomicrobia bacterium]|nr:LysR substrate-binding domain-containing protein [Candidatus Tectomicrobia bacterium]